VITKFPKNRVIGKFRVEPTGNPTLQECSESSIQKAEYFLRKHFQTSDDRKFGAGTPLFQDRNSMDTNSCVL
jgi:hypothetical protein